MKKIVKMLGLALACAVMAVPFDSLAAGPGGGGGTGGGGIGGGGGGGGIGGGGIGGGGKTPLAFANPAPTGIVVSSGVQVPGISATATSGVAQPVITLDATTFPEITVAGVTSLVSGKNGPLNRTTIDLTSWTPSRAEIGQGSVVLTATDGTTSITNIVPITVQDAPEAISGLFATSDGTTITANWVAPTVGGTGAISYQVQACYLVFTPSATLAPACDVIGLFPSTTATFPAHTSAPTNNPPGTYFEVLVTPVDSLGVQGPLSLFLLP
ncbi:MAG TPA: hypothetical protein VNU21_01300 [Usitatibacter sp.]|nr:hypothetical protein [Usitatibacter sp.]